MKKHTLIEIGVALLFAAAGIVQAADLWSLSGDFSIATNSDSSTWSYRTYSGGAYTLLTNNTRNANALWGTAYASPPLTWNGDGSSYWGIGRNDSGVTQNSASVNGWGPGAVYFHPDTATSGGLVISWLAPTTMTINVEYIFAKVMNVIPANGIRYSITKRAAAGGDTTLTSLTYVGGYGSSLAGSLPIVTVVAGDRLYFFFDNNGDAGGDICSADIRISARQAFDSSVWMSSMPITFTNDARLNTHTNFTALVVLDPSKVKYSQFQANAQDLRFADTNGFELACEVESWNTTSNSYVWVNIPTLTAGCVITAYWGNASAPMPAYRTNGLSWDLGCKAVWHLGETGNTDAGGYRDSTVNTNNGTGVGMAPGTEVASMISTGQNLNGTSQEIQAGDSTSLRPANLTLSAWIKPAAIAGGTYYQLLNKKSGDLSTGYGLWINDAGRLYSEVALKSLTGTTVLTAGNWYHVVLSYDGSDVRICLNGVQENSVANTAAIIHGAYPLRMGASFNNNFNGTMDEVRVSGVGRSTNWIWAEYMNIASNSSFQVLGKPQSRLKGTVICIH